MNIRLIKKLKNAHKGRMYVSHTTLDSPRIYDHEFGQESYSYTIFHDCEVTIGSMFHRKNEEETFAYRLFINPFNVLRVKSLDYQSLENTNNKNISERISLASVEISTEESRPSFVVHLKPNDYSNFLISLNAAETLKTNFSFYKEDETKLEELAKMISETKLTHAKLVKFGNFIDAGRTSIDFF
jgi:hypothetical protein